MACGTGYGPVDTGADEMGDVAPETERNGTGYDGYSISDKC